MHSPQHIKLLLEIAMTLMSYYYGDNGGDGQSYMMYMAILGGAMYGSQFVAMGFVPKLCEKYEKRTKGRNLTLVE